MFDAFLKVALLGRPNVGKSTLFNRLIRSNRAITHDRPGVTRDRMEGIVRPRGGTPFTLVDTGGLTLASSSTLSEGPVGIKGFEKEIMRQAEEAVNEAALLCLVVDAQDGLSPMDRHLADFLRRKNKAVLLVVNKVDGEEKADLLLTEFYELGFDIIPVSASHGFNVRELAKEIYLRLRDMKPEDGGFVEEKILEESIELASQTAEIEVEKGEASEEKGAEVKASLAEDDGFIEDKLPAGLSQKEVREALAEKYEMPFYSAEGPLRLALLGRPNAGKSSLVNAMLGEERMIVSKIAGTTRDSVDISTTIDGEACVFVDTAGVRRRSRITDSVERFSVNSSIKSTTKAHITLLVLDAEEGVTQQDKRLIELLDSRKTPFILLMNKSDLIHGSRLKDAERDVKSILSFCSHVPVLFISAKQNRNLKKIVPLAREMRKECGIRIPTSHLNRALISILDRHQPPIVKTARAKFFYMTQAEVSPPTFVFFVNNAERVLPSYARYMEKSFREIFDVKHAPVRMRFRSSHSKNRK